jgi:ubiquinone/menaquinone biosynthesis C-methylase UbiE
MAGGEAFWDRIAERYAARPVRDAAAYERTIERARFWLSGAQDALELGCGTGTTALRLADAVGRLTAIDYSGRMIAIAAEKARAQSVSNVAFRQADLFDPAAPEGAFDAVLAFNFLQLMADLPAALEAVARRVKPGGVFVSKSVCLGEKGWMPARVLIGALRFAGVAPPLRFLEIDALDRAVREAGFEIVETGVFPERPPSRFIVARRVPAPSAPPSG